MKASTFSSQERVRSLPAVWRAIIACTLALWLSGLSAVEQEAALARQVIGGPGPGSMEAARASLGQRLFFDKRLSSDQSTSCASCHQPESAFTDGRAQATGIHGRSGTRNTPTLLNVRYNTSLFWDGRRRSLEEQALDPFLNEREHGLRNTDELLEIVRNDQEYIYAFHKAFGIVNTEIRPHHIALAIAAFERTIVAEDSPFDRYYFKGEKSSMSSGAVRGLALFIGRAQCVQCHSISRSVTAFTDNDFHSLGVGLHRIGDKLASLSKEVVVLARNRQQLEKVLAEDRQTAELGRFVVTLNPSDIGKFRTPSLRNVALTAPYMHDGSVATLKEAVEVEIYYRGLAAGRPLAITPQEKEDLIEFLKALTSPISILN